jgi:hypothetical protein
MNDEFADFANWRKLFLVYQRLKTTCAKIESPRKKKSRKRKFPGKAIAGFLTAALPPALAIYDRWSRQKPQANFDATVIIGELYDLLNKINTHLGNAEAAKPSGQVLLSNTDAEYLLSELVKLNECLKKKKSCSS